MLSTETQERSYLPYMQERLSPSADLTVRHEVLGYNHQANVVDEGQTGRGSLNALNGRKNCKRAERGCQG